MACCVSVIMYFAGQTKKEEWIYTLNFSNKKYALTYINPSWKWLFKILTIINDFIRTSVAFQGLPDVSLPVWVPKPCAQITKNWCKTTLFNHIVNTNASTLSQTFNLSNTLKIIELETICMPVSATEVCLNVSQSIVC